MTMADAQDGLEPAAAVELSRQRLEQARAREPRVQRLTDRLRRRLDHLEPDQFASRLGETFGRETP